MEFLLWRLKSAANFHVNCVVNIQWCIHVQTITCSRNALEGTTKKTHNIHEQAMLAEQPKAQDRLRKLKEIEEETEATLLEIHRRLDLLIRTLSFTWKVFNTFILGTLAWSKVYCDGMICFLLNIK